MSEALATIDEPKNVGGRPAKYSDPEAMQAVIDRYFTDCRRNQIARAQNTMLDDTITEDERPTVTGLSLTLGFNGRQSLIDYVTRKVDADRFADTVKRAKARVEQALEQRLYESSPAGAIFSLKNNYGWRDEKHLSVDVEEKRTLTIIAPQGLTGRTEGALIEHDDD